VGEMGFLKKEQPFLSWLESISSLYTLVKNAFLELAKISTVGIKKLIKAEINCLIVYFIYP
jgi:hypothetical protein